MNRHVKAFVTSALSIVPMIAIVVVLSLAGIAPLDAARGDYWLLLVGMFVLILGLAVFQIGANRSLTKVGEYMGGSLSKQKSLFIVVLFSLALGALITVAEPSIMIVSKQVNIQPVLLIGGIAIGVGVFVVLGVLRILFHRSLKLWYLFFYAMTFMLLCLIVLDPSKASFLPFIFDSGGVTTGSATVPFILSLGAGIAMVRGGRNAQNDSFGLVGIASVGPIITVALLLFVLPTNGDFIPTYTTLDEACSNVFATFFFAWAPHATSSGFVLGSSVEVLIALAPILVIFLVYDLIFLRLPRKKITSLLIGFLFAFLGLSLFLCGTSAAMTPIGNEVGVKLGLQENWVIVLVAFIVGLVTILCEPAVHVLTGQMEQMSDGNIKKITVLLTLSLGVGVAIALAVIRAIFGFSIMYYMIPGYAISLALMFLCPDIYTAMAFDSGGTASGPMASSFVLPMVVGITSSIGALPDESGSINYYNRAFGVIALIALTPVIAIQILGVIQRLKTVSKELKMRKIAYSADDAEIIHF